MAAGSVDMGPLHWPVVGSAHRGHPDGETPYHAESGISKGLKFYLLVEGGHPHKG